MTPHLVNLWICRVHLRGVGQQLFAFLLRIRLEAEKKVTGKRLTHRVDSSPNAGLRTGGECSPEIGKIQLRHADQCSTRAPPDLALVFRLVCRTCASVDAQFGPLERRKLGLQDGQRVAEMRERFLRRRGQLCEVQMRRRGRIGQCRRELDRRGKVLNEQS